MKNDYPHFCAQKKVWFLLNGITSQTKLNFKEYENDEMQKRLSIEKTVRLL